MIRVAYLSEDGQTLISGGEELLDQPGRKWIDVEGPTEEVLFRLGERFGLHRLALEDCLHLDQRPKVEDYPKHEFIVLHGFSVSPKDPGQLTLHEVHFLLGDEFLVTVHEQPHEAIEDALRRLGIDAGHAFARGADYLLYVVADALVDRNFPLLDAMYSAIDDLEERVFEIAEKADLARIFALKRSLVLYRKVISPQRDVVASLMRGGLPHIQERNTIYFRDIYDHLVRVHEGIETARDLLANCRDAWSSTIANRTNDITKQLTIFATIFLPLSFITGFFGQNFEGINTSFYFWLMWVLIFALPLGMMGWFRHKRWF